MSRGTCLQLQRRGGGQAALAVLQKASDAAVCITWLLDTLDTYAVENWSIRLAIVREEASSILRVWGGMEAESSSR